MVPDIDLLARVFRPAMIEVSQRTDLAANALMNVNNQLGNTANPLMPFNANLIGDEPFKKASDVRQSLNSPLFWCVQIASYFQNTFDNDFDPAGAETGGMGGTESGVVTIFQETIRDYWNYHYDTIWNKPGDPSSGKTFVRSLDDFIECIVAHEVGHTFGLGHDASLDGPLMNYGRVFTDLSVPGFSSKGLRQIVERNKPQ